MNRPALVFIALAGLAIAFELPGHPAGATARGNATPTPSASPSPAATSGGTAPPSPTVVVPLVDLSVGATPSPSPSPTPTDVPAPSTEQVGPTDTPSPSPTPKKRRTYVKATPTPVPTATPTPIPTAGPSTSAPQPTFAATAAPVQVPVATRAPDQSDGQPTTIPTQPPTPRPIAPFQPSIPESLDDPNVQSILARPIPQLSQFSWMTGTWRSHAVESHGNGQQRDLGKNTYVFASTMNGRWLFGGDGKGSDYFYITFDPFGRHFVLVRLNQNPAYGIWISYTGWRQDRIQFDSSYSWVNGRQYHRRITIIRLDARQFSLFDEEQLPSGAWLADDTVQLTKQ